MLSRFAGLLFVVVLLMVMLVSGGCAGGLTGKHGFVQRDVDAQRFLTSKWQQDLNAKNWNGVAAGYTLDAILMPPNGPIIQGRENIKQFFMNFPPISDMKLQLVEIEGRDDIAFVRDVYSMNINLPTGATVRDTGKYIELRKKQADGTWLISHDMFSSDLPASH